MVDEANLSSYGFVEATEDHQKHLGAPLTVAYNTMPSHVHTQCLVSRQPPTPDEHTSGRSTYGTWKPCALARWFQQAS